MNGPRVVLLAALALLLILRSRGYRITLKDGVVLALSPEMSRALPLIDRAHELCGIERDAVITSGSEGEHSPGSLHYIGQAVDIRSRDLDYWQRQCLLNWLRSLLGPDYDVVDESLTVSPHIHIEYDPN